MPAIKVTPDAAMRARDVSRPHAEQLRWAEDAEANATGATGATDVVSKADVVLAADGLTEENTATETEVAVETEVVVEVDVTGGFARRRFRGTRSSRRGRPTR
jgi:hypothetical protein